MPRIEFKINFSLINKCEICRSPSKSKKTKSFKFTTKSKEKREKSRDKEISDKKKDRDKKIDKKCEKEKGKKVKQNVEETVDIAGKQLIFLILTSREKQYHFRCFAYIWSKFRASSGTKSMP